MNMITYFNELVTKNFNDYLKKYFNNMNYTDKTGNFINYYNFMHDLDSFNDSFMKDLIKEYFEYVDECFFHSSYRKNFCDSNGFYERKNFVTLFGEINFKRRYYFDNNTKEYFFFTDLFLGLPKRKHFDPFVCAELCDQSTTESYSKAGKIIANKIGKRINNNIVISRATTRNIVLSFNPEYNEQLELRRVEKLFVMLDEKFIASQFNDGTKVQFAMDNFHFKKALIQLTTQKYPDVCEALQEYIDSNNKKDFNMLLQQFKDLFPGRIETIESKQNYILNNWTERQTYLKNPHMKCSMESHISHLLADLFAARPKAYSEKGLRKLLNLRC